MYRKNCQLILAVFCCNAAVIGAYQFDANDFASSIISSQGSFGPAPYDNPAAVLAKPSTWIYDSEEDEIFACSLVYSAWSTTSDGNELVVTISSDSNIVIGFNHPVRGDTQNLYGIDFIVFGNSRFEGDGWVDPNTNMEAYYLLNPTSVYTEPVLVSVAQEPNGPWYTFSNGPYSDSLFPTNAFAWDSNTHSWGEELNWLKPVDPNLGTADFDGLSAAEAISLYDGSAGGTGFDLKWLDPNDYEQLDTDPNTGCKWIKYIKVEYKSGSAQPGEIDAFADVACCGDYKHPFPAGDIDKNCLVDLYDLKLLTDYWLFEIIAPEDPADKADLHDDDKVDFKDFALLAQTWLNCTWQCQ